MTAAPWRLFAAACGALALGAAGAQQADGPDLEFLEYLGTWQASDEEWLAVERWQRDGAAPRERRPGKETETEADADDEQ